MPLEDVVIGALSPGVNNATFATLNAILFLLILLLFILLFAAGGVHPELLPHIGALLGFAIVTLAGINWLVSSTGGTVPVEQQRQSLRVTGLIVHEEERVLLAPEEQKELRKYQ